MKKSTRYLLPIISSFLGITYASTVIDFDIDQDNNAIVAGAGISGGNPSDADLEGISGIDGTGFNFAAENPYNNVFGGGNGVTFSTSVSVLTVYDTTVGSAADPDLNLGYEGGNVADGNFGNALIIQEVGVSIDNPDDEGGGGILTITSDLALNSFAFTIIDLDNGSVAASTFTARDTSTDEFVTFSLQLFEDPAVEIGTPVSAFNTTGVDIDDSHANFIDSVTLANLQTLNPDLVSFDQIEINFQGSGALGDITLGTFVTIPEPTSVALLGLGGLTLIGRRKRK